VTTNLLPLDMSRGSNVGLEHQVELDGCSQLVTSSRIPDVVLFDQLAKLGTAKVVNLDSQLSQVRANTI
jgi:hypothetical protein